MLKFKLTSILIVLCVVTIVGQNQVVPLGNEVSYKFESLLFKKRDVNFHSNVRPYIQKDISDVVSDSLLTSKMRSKNKVIGIAPLAQISAKTQAGNDSRFTFGGGLALDLNLAKKFAISGFYQFVQLPRFNYLDSSNYMGNTVNGVGYDLGGNTAHHAEFYASYSPNKYFSILAGNGKNFWGDGYRSFILSDNSAPYPFLRINSTFWNVRYTNIYAMHTDTYNGGIKRKYATMHQLSWNIIRNLNFSVFESVIFSAEDTLAKRGFDVNYLNPIIFYRPVEYTQGSSDNVLLGGSLKYTLEEKYVFYSQFVLDEFLLSEYRNNKGWWANKFAVQLGFKTYDIANIKNLSFQTELNFARPYTFSHVTSLVNYGNNSQAIGHPLGANFHESVTRIRYQKDRWYFELKVIYIDRGEDALGTNYGGDIFKNYATREHEFENSIGQGSQHIIWYNKLDVSYNLLPKMNLRGFASYAFRSDNNAASNTVYHLLQVGVRTNFWNIYNDY